jgi:hypothetical protein
MNSDPTSIQPTVADLVDVFPANVKSQWPIIKDMWTFFAGNDGNINILSVLGTNDVIFIKGMKDAYRVTIYESDYPEYIPYL